MPLSQADRIAQVETPFGTNKAVLLSMRGSETLSRLPSFELQLISEDKALDPKQILGKTVGVTLNVANGKKRYFHGHAIQFGGATFKERYFAYHLTIVPWFWFLTRTTNCRIFQKKNVIDIVQQVFEDHGFDDLQLRLDGKYTEWEYCVQYRETDFNFVSRLLEQEGICYFFTYEEKKHTMVLADAPTKHQAFPGYAKVRMLRPSAAGSVEDRDVIREWASQMNHVSGVFTHDDYDFEKPRTDLTSRSEMPGEYTKSSFEVFDSPGEYTLNDDGQSWARVRMEEIHTQTAVATGWGECRGIAPGCSFQLTEAGQGFDGKYLITSVQHDLRPDEYETGRADGGLVYSCQFVTQPADVQFRPARVTPKPRTFGVHTAVVVGPAGDEIYTDKYGRIKVQFHWDREGKKDENSSCWIRVGQIWAGRRWGATFIPRIGQEVIVDFLEGDPDLPIVIGSVYNGDQMPPYLGDGLDPKHKNDPNVSGIKSCSTKGGAGYNEIRFDDTKGKEQIFIHGEKDMDVRIKNDERIDVGHAVYVTVGKAKEGEINSLVQGKVVMHITNSFGMQTDKEIHVECGTSGQCLDVQKNSGSRQLKTAQEFTVASGTIVLEGQQICLNAGSSFIKLGPDGIYLSGPMIYLNSGGAPLSAGQPQQFNPTDPNEADDSKSGSPSK
jgi:type VI secretion system secreted protein VgrG